MQHVAVFRDRAAGQDRAIGDGIIAERIGGIFPGDHLLNAVTDGCGRGPAFAIRIPGKRGAKEPLEAHGALRCNHQDAGGHAAYGAFVHADCLRHIGQGHGRDLGWAMLEKCRLTARDFGTHGKGGLIAMLDRAA